MKSFQSQTHYEVLEISVGATAADVRHAYERLSQLYSNDQVALYGMVEPARAAALRARLKEALDVLIDDARRDAYDVKIGLPPREVPKPPPPPAARPLAPSPAGASAATGWGAFAWVTPAPSAPPPGTSSYTYAPAPTRPVAAPPPALVSAPAVASPVPAATQAPASLQLAHDVSVAVAPRGAPPDRDVPGDAPPPATSVASAVLPVPRGSAPLPSPHASPAPPPMAEPPSALLVAAPLPSIPVSLASAPLAAPPAPAPAPTPVAPPLPSIPVPLTSAPPPAPAPTPAAPPVEVVPAPTPPPGPVSAPAAPAPDLVHPDAPVLSDESVEVSIVPMRASPSREFKVEQRPRPYEIPEGVEINGDLLRQVRMARGLTLAQLGERTRIGVKHLENVEADRYDALPASVYLRGILMSLARELGLDGLRVSKSYLTFVDAHRSKG